MHHFSKSNGDRKIDKHLFILFISKRGIPNAFFNSEKRQIFHSEKREQNLASLILTL